MKRTFLILALAASLVSCGHEQMTPASKLDMSGNVYALAKDFVTGNEISKTVITQTGTSAPAFAWKEGDVIGVIPMDNKTIQSNYDVAQIDTDPKHAVFDGGVWALKDGKSYAAYYPFNEEIARSGDDLEFSFLGQKQSSDNSLEHLGAYDYMYAGSVVCADNVATFQFSHLISLVRLQLTVPAADTFTALTLDAEDEWFADNASLKLADGTFTAVEAQKSFTLELNNIAVTAGSTLTVWFSTLPTASLKNKDLCVTLSGAKGDMEGEITVAEEWESGKAYSYAYTFQSPESGLVAPKNDARIELDYTTPDATVTFSWTDVADSYSLYIGTDETMEGAGKVADLTDPAMSLKYSDIQAGFIDSETSTLHRYTDNTLYWNVKLPNGSWLAEKANSFVLRGMMIYKDLRHESEGEIVYHVSHVKTANYDAIWMAEDLKTMYSVEGVHFSDIKVEGTSSGYNQFADYGLEWEGKPSWTGDDYRKTDKVIPKYFIDLGTVYYRSTADTPKYLNKDGWCVPTAAEISALFNEALSERGGKKACVLRDYDRYAPDENGTSTYTYTWDAPKEQWNTWKMNMGPNGIYYYGRMNFAYFHSGRDHSNPTEAYEIFYTIDTSNDSDNAGKHFMFWGDDISICKGWWDDAKSLCPVRMIYKGR